MIFLVLSICLLGGLWAQRSQRFPQNSGAVLNAFVITVSLPALMVVQVPKLLSMTPFHWSWLLPMLMPWLVLLGAWSIFAWIGHRSRWSRATIGALVLTAGLGNTSFVGFPLVEALIGPEALKIAVVVDQLGSFLALSVLGTLVAARYAGEGTSISQVAMRIVRFPPFLALIAVGLWVTFGMPAEKWLTPTAERISLTLVPLALFAVGLQLKPNWSVMRNLRVPLLGGLAYKLLLAPAVMAGFTYGESSELVQVTVLHAGMAPMITAAVVAGEYRLNTDLASLMVGLGIPLSLLTVPLWHVWLV